MVGDFFYAEEDASRFGDKLRSCSTADTQKQVLHHNHTTLLRAQFSLVKILSLSRGLGLGFASAEPYSAPPPQDGLVLGGFVPKNH